MAPGVEMGDVNWMAIGIATAINIVLGFLWYSPKMPTGKVWMRGIGMRADFKPEPKKMAVAMVLMVVGGVLVNFVLAHNFVAYHDAYKLDGARMEGLAVMDGVTGGFFTWLGFFLPLLWGAATWENRPWSYVAVNAAYYLVALVVAGILLVTV